MTHDTTTRQRAMATRWWTLTAPILINPDNHPDGIICPEPLPHTNPDSGIIECKAGGLSVCTYNFGIGGALSGHVYYRSASYPICENANDNEITTAATHARHLLDTITAIDNRRWHDDTLTTGENS